MNTPHTPMNDDELGAALGSSIRGRVDTVPTITPGFDGVERRARQITNRRRALAGAAVGAFALVAGIGVASIVADEDAGVPDVATNENNNDDIDNPAPNSTDGSVDDGTTDDGSTDEGPVEPGPSDPVVVDETVTLPRSVVGVVDGVAMMAPADGSDPAPIAGVDTVERVLHVEEQTMAFQTGGEGGVVLLTYGDRREVSPDGFLLGGANVEGVATIWFNGSDEQGELQLRRHDVLTGSTTTFVEGAFTPTRSPWSVSAGAGRVLIEYGGTDGSWELVDATGTALDLATPTDGRFGENYARTGVDVYGFSPVLSTDGTTIYWIEDPAGPSGSGPLTIRSLDVESGEAGPAIEIPFEDGINAPVPALSVHGDHMLVSFPGFMPIEPVAPILVELTGAATTVETNLPSGRWEFATARQAPAPPANTAPVPVGEWTPLADLGLDGAPSSGFDPGGPLPTDESLVAVIDGLVSVVTPAGTVSTSVGDADIGAVRLVEDGSLLVQLDHQELVRVTGRDSASTVVQIRDDEYRVLSDDGVLLGSDGRFAFVGDLPVFDGTTQGQTGDVRRIDLDSGESTVLGADAFGIEWVVYEVFAADDRFLLDGAGYQPIWIYRDSEGRPLELASPSDGRYGADWANEVDGVGPDAQRPALSADGSTLYWIELETGDPATLEVTAVLHAMDVATGEEAPTIDIDLDTSEIRIHADLTISGSDQLLLTRWFDGGLDEHGQVIQTWQPPLVIDPATGDVQPVGLPGADWHFAG